MTLITYNYRYTVLFRPAGPGYVVTCPALPGLVTVGETFEEARAMAADAIRSYLSSLRKGGLPFPAEDYQLLAEQIEVAIAVV